MRRKIEKFLAQKKGVDESQIIPAEDGRYEFDYDFEGVLEAVRGKDLASGGSNRKRATSTAKKEARRQSQQPPLPSMRPSLPPPMSYYYPPPYSMAGSSFPGMYAPPHMGAPPLPAPMGKENSMYLPPTYWAASSQMAAVTMGMHMSPPAPAPQFGLSTPGDKPFDNFPAGSLLSAKKSIFDSPTPKQHRLDDLMMIGGNFNQNSKLDVRGMTPPMSDLKDTFATPLGTTVENASLTKEEAESLNKSLFSDAVVATPFAAAAIAKRPAQKIHFAIGVESGKDYADNDMKLGNRVSISPIYQDAGKASFFEDDDELDKSIPPPPRPAEKSDDDKETMPPPTAPRTAPKTAPRSLGGGSTAVSKLQNFADFTKTPGLTPGGFADDPTPFDSCKMAKELTQTPGTAATVENSFWSEHGMSPVPLSPFQSPTFTDHPTTTKKRKLAAEDAEKLQQEATEAVDSLLLKQEDCQ